MCAFSSEPSVKVNNVEKIYQAFLENRLVYLQKLIDSRPTRTRYSFVKLLSKHFDISEKQAEFWVEVYDKNTRNHYFLPT